MKADQIKSLRSDLAAIRGWATCFVPFPMNLMELSGSCILNGVRAAPLQSICGTVEKWLALS